MTELSMLSRLRRSDATDDAFLYDVFCTTWQSEVAALPNQNLAQHVLRIQHIAQERRFASRYPGYERFIVVEDGEPVGRLYVHQSGTALQLIDLTLLPAFRGRGLGTGLVQDLFGEATREDRSIVLRVGRRHRQTTDFYVAMGFRLVGVDDLDNHFEWAPSAPDGLLDEIASHESAALPDLGRR